jgi:Family of unknown function (DUF6368)
MAGSVHYVLTHKLTATDIETVGKWLAKVARINDYQIQPAECKYAWDIQLWDGAVSRQRQQQKQRPEQTHPLLVTAANLSAAEIDSYQTVLPNFLAGSRIEIASMLNRMESKRSMAELEIQLLQIFGGYVDLLSILYPPELYGQADIEYETEITNYTAHVPGKIYKCYYEIADQGRQCFSQIIDRQFLINWLQDPRFNFAK